MKTKLANGHRPITYEYASPDCPHQNEAKLWGMDQDSGSVRHTAWICKDCGGIRPLVQVRPRTRPDYRIPAALFLLAAAALVVAWIWLL